MSEYGVVAIAETEGVRTVINGGRFLSLKVAVLAQTRIARKIRLATSMQMTRNTSVITLASDGCKIEIHVGERFSTRSGTVEETLLEIAKEANPRPETPAIPPTAGVLEVTDGEGRKAKALQHTHANALPETWAGLWPNSQTRSFRDGDWQIRNDSDELFLVASPYRWQLHHPAGPTQVIADGDWVVVCEGEALLVSDLTFRADYVVAA